MLAAAAFGALCVTGCARDEVDPQFRAALQQALADDDSASAPALREFYAAREYAPYWTGRAGWFGGAEYRQARALLEALRAAGDHGLPSAPYRIQRLEQTLARSDAAARRAEAEQLFSAVFLRYAADLARGRLDPADVDPQWLIPRRSFDPQQALTLLDAHGPAEALAQVQPADENYQRLLEARRRFAAAGHRWPGLRYEGLIQPGDRHPAVPDLRARLRASGELGGDAGGDAGSEHYDEATVAAVKAFQRRHGLAVDGVLGPEALAMLNVSAEQRLQQIDANLERLRWLPDPVGRRQVRVNLAAFELQAGEADRAHPALQMRVIVGEAQNETPAFADRIEYLQINPYWHVPNSIVVDELAPRIARDPGYLAANDMEVVDGPGLDAATIDPATIDWAAYAEPGARFPHVLRQRPGPKNALGRIKFIFPNRHAIYLHDTPADHLFDEARRTFSHGCIRVESPIELADWLLAGTAGWDGARVQEEIARKAYTRVDLAEPVPVYLYYLTAWSDGEQLYFRPDVYGRDQAMAEQIAGSRGAA